MKKIQIKKMMEKKNQVDIQNIDILLVAHNFGFVQPLQYVYIYFYQIINNDDLVLTCFAGCMSGLTVGYLSINDLDLEMKLKTGTAEEKR